MREYTTKKLNKISPQTLINLDEIQQSQLKVINAQLIFLTEQIAILNQHSFSRKSETSGVLENQLTFDDIFNKQKTFMMIQNNRKSLKSQLTSICSG